MSRLLPPSSHMNTSKNSKILLGKLLANEDISMVYSRNTSGPFFDVKTRTLSLPEWAGSQRNIEDLMIGHEVGHALYTPTEKWMAIVHTSPILKQYVNVVEDVRIERFIKDKYPGLRLPMRQGYEMLRERGFFGEPLNVDTMSFADRLNLHFKLGTSISLTFTDEQEKLIDIIERANTFDEVVKAAKMLMVMDNNSSSQEESKQLTFEEMFDLLFSEENVDAKACGEKSSTEPSHEERFQDCLKNIEERFQNLDIVLTNAVFERLYDSLISNGSNRSYSFSRIPRLPYDDIVVPSDIVFRLSKQHYRFDDSMYTTLYTNFLKTHKAHIDHLLREFEIKKAAHAFDKQRTYKSGRLNVDKLWRHNFSEDVFLTNVTVPKGKNHGMIMLLDFSSSMENIIHETIQQAISLAIFCRRAGIPFEMYSFNDNSFYGREAEAMNKNRENRAFIATKRSIDDIVFINKDFRLQQLLHSGMSTKVFRESVGIMEAAGFTLSPSRFSDLYPEELHGRSAPPSFTLAQTPLCEAAVSLFSVTERFQQLYSPEVLNTIILTDGEPTGLLYKLGDNNQKIRIGQDFYNTFEYGPTRQRLDLPAQRTSGGLIFYALMDLYRHVTGANTIGYYLLDGSSRQGERTLDVFLHTLQRFEDRLPEGIETVLLKNFAEKYDFITMNTRGFNAFFACLCRPPQTDRMEEGFGAPLSRKEWNSPRSKKRKKTIDSLQTLNEMFTAAQFEKKTRKMFITNFVSQIVAT